MNTSLNLTKKSFFVSSPTHLIPTHYQTLAAAPTLNGKAGLLPV
jgi:hypothetical protein